MAIITFPMLFTLVSALVGIKPLLLVAFDDEQGALGSFIIGIRFMDGWLFVSISDMTGAFGLTFTLFNMGFICTLFIIRCMLLGGGAMLCILFEPTGSILGPLE